MKKTGMATIIAGGICGLFLAGCTTPVASVPPPPPSPLNGTYWTLTSLRSKPARGPKNASEVHIRFSQTGEVDGFTGCTRYTGRGNVVDNQVKFIVKTTGTECGKNQKFENTFLDTLGTAKYYRLTGNTLYLLDENNNELAQFSRR